MRSGKFLIVPLIVSLLAAYPALAANQHIVVILDDSGSMDQTMERRPDLTRMDAALQALSAALATLPADAEVGIARLNGNSDPRRWVVPPGPVNLSQAQTALDAVRAKGGTPLGEFLKIGADELLKARAKDHYGEYRLLVVTDGEANDGELLEHYLPDILSRGLQVDAIGVDMREDHSLATKVHSYRRADDPESLTRAVKEVFAETGGGNEDDTLVDFSSLEGLPDDVAAAALAALADTGNQPIGVRSSDEAPDPDDPDAEPGNTPSAPRKRRAPDSGSLLLRLLLLIVILTVVKGFRRGRWKARR